MTHLLEGKNAIVYGAGGSLGGVVAVLDALDERAVNEHAAAVGLHASFNSASRGDRQGTPLVEMSTADFVNAVTAVAAETGPSGVRVVGVQTAAFLASDRAGTITSGIVNATCGLVAG